MHKPNKFLILFFITIPVIIMGFVLPNNKSFVTHNNSESSKYPKNEIYNPKDAESLFYISNVTPTEITLDFVLKIPDVENNKETLEGTKACLDDGKCSPIWCDINAKKSCLPNGFYLRNNNNTKVTYKVTENVSIKVINSRQIEAPINISLSDLIDQYAKDPTFKTRIFKIRLVDNVIYNLTEMYNP